MKLAGSVFDFGDQPVSEHLRDIAAELEEQAFLSGEDDADISRGYRPFYDLSTLLGRVAEDVQKLEEFGRK
ncbi:MAG TPA: hypothetical protein VFH72_04030 [Candidatus Baltobacteraceae bacterium]|nr:hypothetical protein [Candidatus Baltobacteraceae bacterium]